MDPVLEKTISSKTSEQYQCHSYSKVYQSLLRLLRHKKSKHREDMLNLKDSDKSKSKMEFLS